MSDEFITGTNKFVAALAALVIIAIFGCTEHRKEPGNDAVPRMGNVVTTALRALEAKVEAKARADNRAEMRRFYRAQGKRVCEEGEVGTRWMEDCNTCWCHEPGIRRCTQKRCNFPGSPPIHIPHPLADSAGATAQR